MWNAKAMNCQDLHKMLKKFNGEIMKMNWFGPLEEEMKESW